MISIIDAIELDQKEPDIFKNIGQIIKVYIEKKISQDLYLIRFSKRSLLVQSKIRLKEGQYLTLRVESLRPKVILKPLNNKKTEFTSKSIEFLKLASKKPSLQIIIKDIYKKIPELKAITQIIFNSKLLKYKIFWDNLKKIHLYFCKEDLFKLNNINFTKQSFNYVSFVKTINGYLEGLYLQIPYFYSFRDIEVFFSFNKIASSNQKNYIIRINLELSKLGPVEIAISCMGEIIDIKFYVKEESYSLINRQLNLLIETLRNNYQSKHINIDCKIRSNEYWEKGFYFNLMNQKNGLVDFVA